MKRLLVDLALVAGVASTAQAMTFSQFQPEKSSIAFNFSQMGVGMDGHFKRLSSQLAFDPVQPAAAKVAVEVDLGSIDTGSKELDVEALGKEWFNIKSFPTARFASTSVTSLGGNRYSVAGRLTVKGRARDIVVPATFKAQGTSGVFEGAFTIHRADFQVGEGSWSAFDIVANDVQVRFRIAALGQ